MDQRPLIRSACARQPLHERPYNRIELHRHFRKARELPDFQIPPGMRSRYSAPSPTDPWVHLEKRCFKTHRIWPRWPKP